MAWDFHLPSQTAAWNRERDLGEQENNLKPGGNRITTSWAERQKERGGNRRIWSL